MLAFSQFFSTLFTPAFSQFRISALLRMIRAPAIAFLIITFELFDEKQLHEFELSLQELSSMPWNVLRAER